MDVEPRAGDSREAPWDEVFRKLSESENAGAAPALRVVPSPAAEGPSRPAAPPAAPPPQPGPAPTARQPPPAASPPPRGGLLRRLRWPLIIGGPLIIIAIAAWFFLTAGRSQATDNAYVQVARAPVSASINGRVLEVYVTENQHVRAGERLFRLDTRDAAAALAQAEAVVAQQRANVRATQQNFVQQRAAIAAAQEQVAYTAREAVRQQALFRVGVASRQQADEARHAADQARAQLVNAQQQARTAQAQTGGYTDSNHPDVLAAEANLERARLAVSYGVVVAPADGIVTRVEQLQPGAYINASQTLFWLLRGAPWIDANFKEDQLVYMRTGQPVEIHVDACQGTYEGRVASFSPGTGSAFSALPAQNATGNWVKVTQRLPVRIEFVRPPPEACGRAGLSAHVTVDVRSGRPEAAPAATPTAPAQPAAARR